jgi:DNA-binding NarL/FixJ family response regulator
MTRDQDSQTRVMIVSLPGMMQNIIRETFIRRVDIDLVGIACGGLSAIKMIGQYLPDLIVINSNLPETETSELIQWLKEEHPQIVSLALGETSHEVSRAANAGADFALLSYSLPDQLNRLNGSLSKYFRTANK